MPFARSSSAPKTSNNEVVPCHHIPLDEAGETIENLETADDQAKLERKVRDWLRFRIREIEEQRATQAVA